MLSPGAMLPPGGHLVMSGDISVHYWGRDQGCYSAPRRAPISAVLTLQNPTVTSQRPERVSPNEKLTTWPPSCPPTPGPATLRRAPGPSLPGLLVSWSHHAPAHRPLVHVALGQLTPPGYKSPGTPECLRSVDLNVTVTARAS